MLSHRTYGPSLQEHLLPESTRIPIYNKKLLIMSSFTSPKLTEEGADIPVRILDLTPEAFRGIPVPRCRRIFVTTFLDPLVSW